MMRQRGLVWFVAAVTAVTLELVRSTGPLMDGVYSSAGMNTAMALAVATFAGPGVVVAAVAVLCRALPRHDAAVVLVAPAALLVALRLAAQGATGEVRLGITLAAIATSLAVLVLAVDALASDCRGGRVAAAAVGCGLVVAVLVQLVLGTWDAIWRHSVTGWAVSGLMCLAVLGTAVFAAREVHDRGRAGRRRLWALGPFLALATLITANPAFVASQADVAPLAAGAVAALGLVGAAALALRLSSRRPLATTAATAVVLVITVLALLGVPRAGPAAPALVVAGIVVLQVTATLALSTALAHGPREAGTTGSLVGWRTAMAATVVGLTAIVPMMLFQIEYRTPLGYPNYWSVTAAALLLGAAGVRGRAEPRASTSRRTTRLGVVVVVTAGVLAVVGIRPVVAADRVLDPPDPTDAASVRILDWNMHYAVSGSGSLDLEAVARAVERHHPDVVMLNEVSRGWLIGGGADDAGWLAQRLGGHWTFAAGADRQFGNVLLSRWPLADVRRIELPRAGGTQARSMVAATFATELGDLTVVSVHLEDGAGRAAVRREQVPALLDSLAGMESPLVFGGDLNAEPTSEEIAAITEAGYVSAIDDVGDPDALTQPSDEPDRRIDWVFGRDVRFMTAEVLADERASDHLPVLVTLVP